MPDFFDWWGSGAGPVRALFPGTRLGCGLLLLAAGLVMPLGCLAHVLLWLLLFCVWIPLCGLSARRLAATLAFALTMFSPLLAVVVMAEYFEPSGGYGPALRTACLACMRGCYCVVMSAATLSTMTLGELGEGLAGLGVPSAVLTVVVQIAHQLGLMSEESRRIALALRLRGLQTARPMCRLRVACGFPVLWLLRLLARAERVGAAMEVRGFAGVVALDCAEKRRLTRCDVWARLLSGAALAVGVTARILA